MRSGPFCRWWGYLPPWQQLSVQPLLQQLCPHLSWQQCLQAMALAANADGTKAPMASTNPNESNAMVRFIRFSFTLTNGGCVASCEAESQSLYVRSGLDPEDPVQQVERRRDSRIGRAQPGGSSGELVRETFARYQGRMGSSGGPLQRGKLGEGLSGGERTAAAGTRCRGHGSGHRAIHAHAAHAHWTTGSAGQRRAGQSRQCRLDCKQSHSQ